MPSFLKPALKGAMFRLAPKLATRVFAARSRAHSHTLVRAWGCLDLNEKLTRRFGTQVLAGPFAGVALSAEAAREHLGPYLLGTYEGELHKVWESVFRMKFSQILDVGAKFGFYAVGLAKRFPGVPVLAFDPDPWAQRATREMSAANGVNVRVLGFCSPEWLQRHVEQDAFILSDCEGYEQTLFGTASIPQLTTATMVIEIHEQFSPGVTELIQSHYHATHKITRIPARTDDVETPPDLDFLTANERKMATNEYRTANQQSWMFLIPKSRST